MSAQPSFSFNSIPLNETFIEGPFLVPHYYSHHSESYSVQPTAKPEDHRVPAGQHLTPERQRPEINLNVSCPETTFPWRPPCHESHPVLQSAHLSRMHTPHEFELHGPSVQQGVEVLSSPSFSTEVNMGHMSSSSHCDPGRNTTHDGVMTSDPSYLWMAPSDRQPLLPLVDPTFPGQPSVHPSARFPHSHQSSSSDDKNEQEPFITLRSPYLFGPTSPHFIPPLSSSMFLGSDPHSHLAFYRATRSGSTGSSRYRRGARAIECCGLWIDEEDLLKSLSEPDGMLVVHPCLWEDDRNPCHLWIKGDRSCINAHVKKWHREKPLGEKSNADCRWSACGKRMLKESIARHVLSVHLGEVWECQGCGKDIARSDAYGQHAVKSKFTACRTAGAVVTYFTNARAVDARVALGSGGRVRYARA